MSKDKPHDKKVGGGKKLYHCRECDPKCDKGYALPGKCSICGNPMTDEPPVKTLTANLTKKDEPPDGPLVKT